MTTLPKEINYGAKAQSLPKGTTAINGAVTTPSSGTSFGPSQLIQFNLPSRSYLVPQSMYLRYRITLTAGDSASFMLGAFPGYSTFSRCETIIGSSTVESISNYGVLNNMLMTQKLNYAQKVGLAQAFGVGAVGTAYSFDNCNAHDIAGSAESWTMAIPVNCLFSNADSLIPLKFMPASTIQLTTDTVANLFILGTTPVTNYALTNVELVYDLVDFNDEIDQVVLSMADSRGKIMIKSQSYLTSGQTSTASTSGTIEFVYAMRLASIKSLWLYMGGTHANSLNKQFDSLDITTSNGSYQFNIANVAYPSRPISTSLNKNGALMELSTCFGPAHDLSSANFSINPTEWNYTNNSTTTALLPGKFYIGTNVERLSTGSVLLTGISSQLSPISVRIEIGTQTTNSQNLILCALFDAIIECDLPNRQVNVLT